MTPRDEASGGKPRRVRAQQKHALERTFQYGYATNVGNVRETNQDRYLIADPLFAVADGMGGHKGGETASATALEALEAVFKPNGTTSDLVDAVRKANAKVWEQSQRDENLRGMGTTLTGFARLTGDFGEAIIAVFNVGDSRTYCMHNDQFAQITRDHSFVEEMVQAGELTHEEAESHPRRNVLTRALGVDADVQVDVVELACNPGDRYLICSDGLTREVTDEKIAATLRRFQDPNEAARDLVVQARLNGGHDNITIVIVDVIGDEDHVVTIRTPSRLRKDGTPSAIVEPDPFEETHESAPRIKLGFRMLAFFLAMALLVVSALVMVTWYARSAYFVKTDGDRLVVYRGQPESILWFTPDREETTNVTTAQVPEYAIPVLQKGKKTGTLKGAHDYIQGLLDEKTASVNAIPTTTTTTTTTTTSPAKRKAQ